jgi:hypothetical protein
LDYFYFSLLLLLMLNFIFYALYGLTARLHKMSD